MKKSLLILIFILSFLWNNVKAHTIPSASIPRLSYEAILALPSPHKGDLAYDLTHDIMRLYNNAGWVKMATLPPPPCDSFTALNGISSAHELVYDVATDNAGNVFISGEFYDTVTFGAFTISSDGGSDIFLAKYNSSGNLEWVKRAGGPNGDYGTSLIVDIAENIYVTGFFEGTSQFGSSSLVSSGGYDFFLTYLTIPPPDPTEVSVSSIAICSGVSISLSATCAVGTVTWYDQQTGGTVLGTGSGFSQNPVANTTYYATCVDGNCESSRVATNEVVVTTLPSNPTGTSNPTICYNTTASLSASCATGTVKWYNTNGTTLLFTDSPFVTPNLTSNTAYKVRCEFSSCLSAFVDVQVTVVTAPTGTSNPTICNASAASLSATCATGTVRWYDFGSGAIAFTGSPFVTPNLTTNITYNVRCEQGACLSPFVLIGVSVNSPKRYASKNPLLFLGIVPDAGVPYSGIDVGGYSSPTFTDLDGDHLLDLIIGEQFGKLIHYEQSSGNSLTFTLKSNNFNGIDVPNSTSPVFTDLDGDGLLDLIFGEYEGNLHHYEQNSVNDLTFSLVTNTFNNIDLNSNSKPTFTDLDNDGLLDLIIGEYGGTLVHYEQASANSLIFNLVTNTFNSIDVGFLSSPAFADIDGDGLLDLLVGNYNGNLAHYQQASANSLTFNLVTDIFNYMDTGFESVPTFAHIDGDGLLDLIVGEENGTINRSEQIAGVFTNFATAVGTPSATQTVQVWGTSCITNNITVTAPIGFQVSLNAGSGFGNNVVLTQSGGKILTTTVYVRFNPSSAGAFTGNLQIVSVNTFNVSFALNGCTPFNAPTGTSNPTICNNTTASLSASCATGTIKWYDASSASLLSTTSPFVTPILTSSTTYNVRCEGCSLSDFVPVLVTVNPVVAAPTGTSNPTICNNTTTSLSATCATGTVKWYDANGTALQFTDSPFITPNLSSNTTYKVRCESGGSPNCSSVFVDVTVTVNPVVAAPTGTSNPTICNNTTASLSATCAAGAVKWYDANGTALQSTGSPFITPSLISNTTYKVRCESGGSPNCSSAFVDVNVTVNPVVAVPTGTSNPTICFNTTTSLSATCATGTVKWYDANGTALQSTGSPFLTPSLSSNTTYKVRCESGGSPNCSSAFVDVNVTVNPVVAVPTGTSNPTICFNTTTSLSATCATGTVKWYDANGTALQFTGSPFLTPSLNSNATYKVRCESGGSPNCSSAFVDVSVTVNPEVATPTGTSNPIICNNTTTSLSATCAAGAVKWFDVNGTALQATGSPFLTPNLSANTTYKVLCEVGVCSSSFTTVLVTVNPNVTSPTAVLTSSSGICLGSNITLSATCQNGTITWHNQQTGGAVLGTGNGFSQSPTSNTTYYVSCELGNCKSNRVATSIVLVGTPASNLTITTDISSGNTVQIANQNITATNKVISPARVVYRAGNSISLNVGFEARNGSVFKAEMGGCAN